MSRKQDFWIDSNEISQKISWSFSKFNESFFPFHFYECKIEGFDQVAFGYSVSKIEINALQKSFAESWERLFLARLNEREQRFANIFSSNGFAAGSDNAMAIKKSKEELIERAVLLAAWSQQKGWASIGPRNLKNRMLILGMFLRGWRTYLYNINSNAGVVKACFICHKSLGVIFDCAFDNRDSEEKVLLSVAKNSFFQKAQSNANLPEIGVPEDHRSFYADPKNTDAFQFLKQGDYSSDPVEITNPEQIQSELLVKAGKFPAVAYSSHKDWVQLMWGKQSIQGKNKWPHPLA
ncbi:MAG: hypothetical protein H7235_08315 [Bdellovibrionaceae bacterium]|nr:hypothetical protein [Pseudobdellovibrionaceae bacterium]